MDPPSPPGGPDREVEFRPADLALKDDVGLLGGMLGELLETLESKTLFAHVELARHAARDRRGGDAEAEARLERVLSGLEPEEGVGVTRAFSAYFRLVNMAERVHRVRRRRDYQRTGDARGTSVELLDVDGDGEFGGESDLIAVDGGAFLRVGATTHVWALSVYLR